MLFRHPDLDVVIDRREARTASLERSGWIPLTDDEVTEYEAEQAKARQVDTTPDLGGMTVDGLEDLAKSVQEHNDPATAPTNEGQS